MPELSQEWTGEQFREAARKACKLALDGLTTYGAHHKQWYLEQIVRTFGIDLEDFTETTGLNYEPGIAP
jgi:hypothetical protein